MEELYSLFASELTRKLPALNAAGTAPQTRGLSGNQSSRAKLQLNRFPVVIDLDNYRNSHSSDNPTGDYRAAYRLYELSDEASQLTTFFEGAHSVFLDRPRTLFVFQGCTVWEVFRKTGIR